MAQSQRIFQDRAAAGRELARAILQLKPRSPALVLALPRGGVPVAYEVARAMRAPLDVLVVRKIGLPEQPEFAIGAIAVGDVLVRAARVADADPVFDEVVQRERRELLHRERLYRGGALPLSLHGKTAILVDDGLATGMTMLAAVRAARKAGAASVIAAVPVASTEAAAAVRAEADDLVVLMSPPSFNAVGEWYRTFDQVGDAEVRTLLARDTRSDPHSR
jgi:predicted phosphoribosyltransferase